MYAIKEPTSKEYYNFEEDGFTELKDQCLLPTASLAMGYYDQYIGGDQVIVQLDIVESQRGFITSWSEIVLDFEDIEG
jgi:hypothetical protein